MLVISGNAAAPLHHWQSQDSLHHFPADRMSAPVGQWLEWALASHHLSAGIGAKSASAALCLRRFLRFGEIHTTLHQVCQPYAILFYRISKFSQLFTPSPPSDSQHSRSKTQTPASWPNPPFIRWAADPRPVFILRCWRTCNLHVPNLSSSTYGECDKACCG